MSDAGDELYSDSFRAIRLVLSGARAAFDSGNLPPELRTRALERQYLLLEEIRYRYNSKITNYPRIVIDNELVRATGDLADELRRLIHSRAFSNVASKVRFRPPAGSSSMRGISVPAEIAIMLERPSTRQFSVLDALEIICDFARDVSVRTVVEYKKEIQPSLKLLIPEQKIAPVYFNVRNDKIVVSHKASNPLNLSESIVGPAKEDLIERGGHLLDQLQKSNCDPRLLQSIRKLQSDLQYAENVVQIGLSVLSCGLMHDAFEVELPTAVSAQLKSHTVGVNMYLQQFPDWLQFSQSSVAVRFDSNIARSLAASLEQVVNDLHENPHLSEPEVPKTLSLLRSMMADPSKVSQRVLYAVLRTLENLVIKIFSYGAEFVDSTIIKTSKKVSSAIAYTIAYSLLSLALVASQGLLPAVSSVEGLGWLKDAVVIVRNGILEKR